MKRRNLITYIVFLVLILALFLYRDLLVKGPPPETTLQKTQEVEKPKPQEEKITEGIRVKFYGAAQMVGGSCIYIDTGKTKFIVDLGLFYGEGEAHLNKKLDFDPKELSFVLLTHAHMDHAGRLPLLYKHGYTGKIYGTDASKAILAVMLEMSMKIAEGLGEVIYSYEDYLNTIKNFEAVPYYQKVTLTDDVSAIFYDAGHVLGSSIIKIFMKDKDGNEVSLVVASDMGVKNSPILRDPDIIREGDYVIVEATYGANQKKSGNFDDFAYAIAETVKNGGSVLIPAFVLEKTQKVLYVIGEYKRRGVIPAEVPVYSDSSTAREITKIYRRYFHYYDTEALELYSKQGDIFKFPNFYEMDSKETLKVHDSGKPAIFVSSSGMLEHGAAPKHLEKMIENPKNLVAIVGWQAPNSLGRRLIDGAKRVTITLEELKDGKFEKRTVEKDVRLQVKKFSNFSSHVDACENLEWLSNYKEIKRVIVLHGDKENVNALARLIESKLGLKTYTPAMHEEVYLSHKEKGISPKPQQPLCDVQKKDQFNAKSDQ